MEKVDQYVKSKWREQAEIDLEKFAQSKVELNHKDFAHALYNMLTAKYPWRHWLVIVYDPISGGEKHWMSACGGYIKFRYYNRNIVISSVDEKKPRVNETDAMLTLQNLPTYDSAHKFYHALPPYVQYSCEPFASSGCLQYGYKGFHVGMGFRSFYMARDDAGFTLHLFG